MRGKMIASACAAVLLAAGTAKADLLAYEGFDGNATGFSDTFNAPGTTGAGYATAASLSYGGLMTNGVARQASKSGDWDGERATLDRTYNTGTVWMSWLYQTDAVPTQWTRLKTLEGLSERGNFGLVGDKFTLRTLNPYAGDVVLNSTLPTPNTTYMLVTKYDFSAGRIDLWINPDLGSLGNDTGPTGGYLLTKTGLDPASQMAFNRIGIEGSAGTGQAVFDELRIGTTWAEVSPVPEPAILSLLGISVVGLGVRRRRA